MEKTTLSEQFQNPIEKSSKEAKSISLAANIFMTTHFPSLVQTHQ